MIYVVFSSLATDYITDIKPQKRIADFAYLLQVPVGIIGEYFILSLASVIPLLIAVMIGLSIRQGGPLRFFILGFLLSAVMLKVATLIG